MHHESVCVGEEYLLGFILAQTGAAKRVIKAVKTGDVTNPVRHGADPVEIAAERNGGNTALVYIIHNVTDNVADGGASGGKMLGTKAYADDSAERYYI